jgi:hypothetical protein
MSWDADLTDPDGYEVMNVNYTHNTNEMISEALRLEEGEPAPPCGGSLGFAIGPAWWDRLNGLNGVDGSEYLATIARGLRTQPERFRRMNPDNGWGSYDQLLGLIDEMATTSRNCPDAIWRTSG